MLGSQEGTVHHQRQGTGYATILSSPDYAIKDFLARDTAEQAAKAQAQAAKAKAAQDATKAITEFNPERWLKHDKQIQGMMDQWVSSGAQLLEKGVNPSNSMDPASIAWRRQKAEIEAMSKSSLQMKDMFTATRGKIDGSEEDKYDPQSLQQMKDYFDMPIDKVVKEGILPPPLLQAKPSLNLQKTWAGTTKDLYDRNGGKPLDEAGKWDFTRATMAANPELQESAQSYFINLPQSEQAKYQDRAKQTGRSVNELVNYDFMTRYEPGKEPFDLNKYIQQGVDAIDVPYAEYRDPTRFGKSVDKKEFGRIATEKARVMLTDPSALIEYQKLFPPNPGETEGAYRARAVPDLATRLQGMKATSTSSGITDKGQGDKDETVSAEAWLRDVKSGDKGREERAAQFLFETKGVMGNMNVTAADVVDTYSTKTLTAASDAPMAGTKYLKLTLAGAPTLQRVKEEVLDPNGIKSDNIGFETDQTNSTIFIPITDNTENALLRMHDKAYKTGERKYDPTPLGWSADNIIKQGQPASKPKSQF